MVNGIVGRMGGQTDQLSVGVLGTSSKADEFRLPIHPYHFERIDADLRARIVLEHGYGDRYGASDRQLAGQVAGMRSRAQIIATSDVVPPAHPRMSAIPRWAGALGWPHAVQDSELTRLATTSG
jgi:hypothetical protein